MLSRDNYLHELLRAARALNTPAIRVLSSNEKASALGRVMVDPKTRPGTVRLEGAGGTVAHAVNVGTVSAPQQRILNALA